MSSPETNPKPHIVYGNTSTDVAISPEAAAQGMSELGISPRTIENTTVYVDPANRLATNGIAYPNRLGRLRHILNPDLRDAPGPIVRLSTRVRGVERDEEAIDHTLVHELEHVAQMDRNDKRLRLGHSAIWGLAAVGAIAGNRLGKNSASKTGLTVLGAMVGQQIGYKLAPHERQARSRANVITTSVVTRRINSDKSTT